MPQFTVTIEETVSQDYIINAGSAEAARYKAAVDYDAGVIVLEPGHPQQTRIAVADTSTGKTVLPFEAF